MEFKNAEFEKNASKTLQTLQELKTKLNNNFSTKGPEELNRAIKAVDVNPIVQGLETVQVKFSALQIAGKRIIENLTDAAMTAVHKVTSLLQAPLNQIKQGGAARAQNIEQAKFMLEGLGIAWKDIVDDINYGVQDTAYGLDAAAKVASQLVASNVSLGADMQASLRGVSGVAAMTNSTYEEIGHIFTAVAGQGRLMSMQLQQFSLRGLNVAADLAKSMGTTEAAIRDMVSKGQIDFMTFARAMDELYGGHAKEANKTFTGALSNTKAALSRLGADIAAKRFETIRQILIKIIPQLKALKTAMKPVEDGINSAMEAVGKLVEYLVERVNVTGIVESIAPKIQRVTGKITEFANTAREYIQNLDNTKPGKFIKSLTDTAEKVEEIVKFTEREIELAKQIWYVGDLGNGEDRVRNIEALGESYEHVQAAVNLFIDSGYSWDAVMKQAATDAEKAGEATGEFIEATQQEPTGMWLLVDSLYDIIRVIKNIAGSGKNLFKVIFNSLTGTFGDKSVIEGINGLTGKLADLSDKLYISEERANKLRPVFDALFSIIRMGFKVLMRAGKLFGELSIILAKIFNKARDSKIVNNIFKAIGNGINGIVKGIEKLYNRLKETGAWDKFIDILKSVGTWLGEKLITAFNFIGEKASAMGERLAPIFEKLIDKIKEFKDNSKDGSSWLEKIKGFFKEDVLNGSWITKLKETLENIFGTGKNIFQNAYDKASDFVNGLIQGFKNIDKEDLDSVLKVLSSIALTLSTVKWLYSMTTMNKSFASSFDNFGKMLESIGFTLKKYGKRADAQRFKIFAVSIAIIVGSIVALMTTLAVLEHLNFDADAIMIKATGVVTLMIGFAGLVLILVTYLEKIKYINQVGNRTLSIAPRLSTPTFALVLLSIGHMIVSIIRAVMTIYRLMKEEDFNRAILAEVTLNIAAVLSIITALTYLLIKHSRGNVKIAGISTAMFSMSIMILSLISGFKSIVKAIKGLSDNDISNAIKVMNWLTMPLMIFGLLMALINKIPTTSNSVNPFKGVLGMFTGLAIVMKFGFVPLLKQLVSLQKEGDAGINAIKEFKNITKWLFIFIGIITTVLSVLDRSFDYKGRNIGSAATGANKMTGAWSTASGNGSFWGLTAIVAALAAMFAAIGYVMKNMKGVDSNAITSLKEMVNSVLIIAGIMSLLAGVGGALSGNTVTAALLALAAVIASVAGVMFASAYSFKAFEAALRDLIENLPNMLTKLLDFFNLVKNNKEDITEGIKETISTFFEGITAAVVAWAYGFSKAIPDMVNALFTSLIVTLYELGNAFKQQGPAVVDAAENFAEGLVYFMALVAKKAQETGKKVWQSFFNSMMTSMIKANPTMGALLSKMLGIEYDWLSDEEEDAIDKVLKEQQKSEKKMGSSLSNILSIRDIAKKYLGEAAEKGLEIGDTYLPDFINIKGLNEDDLLQPFSFFETPDPSTIFNQSSFMQQYNKMFDEMNKIGMDGEEDLTDIWEQYNIDSWNILGANTDDYTQVGAEQFNNVGEGIRSKEQFIMECSNAVADAAQRELYGQSPKFVEIGHLWGQGIPIGMTDGNVAYQISKATDSISEDMVTQLRKKLRIESPSKVAMKIGAYFTQGLANGILSLESVVNASTEEVGEATILSMRETLKKLSMEATNELDTSPRITPVLDLSNVTEGIDTMNGMIDTTHAVGLAGITSTEARASARSRFEAMYQNGSNYDDTNTIGAIQSLQGEVSTLKGAIEGMQVVIDGRALVGQIATPIDKALGKKTMAGRRKV